MTREMETQRHSGLRDALKSGFAVLSDGGSALDAVTAAVEVLEDDPLFNAGRGAVFTAAGTLEMEASIMDGRNHRTGAITSLWGPRHPVRAARAVMERTPHVLLSGTGAMEFCRREGLEFCEREWFCTQFRRDALAQHLQTPSALHGTVGAVALDSHGSLSAATSTGGRTGKMVGRVGDTPLIGAGTWADNDTCAVSGTGLGESFIRSQAAHEVDSRIRWGKQSLEAACSAVVFSILPSVGGDGGLIAVDRIGNITLPFNCEGMYRGYISAKDPVLRTAIWKEYEESGTEVWT